ncbi:caspase-3-like isoform X2 [Ornithodoros turicata]|uniref:caspase-3-like isoform X2 n=1 Tax=Ornithodoros turicata TaxID=34597 RepID=UPI00313A0190
MDVAMKHSEEHKEVNDENANSGETVDARTIPAGINLLSFVRRFFPKEDLPCTLPTAVDSLIYNMDHPKRGTCVIFNNKSFDHSTGLNERRGTDEDAAQLYCLFREMDFEVRVHQDFSWRDIISTLEKLGKEDHSQNDCFVCCMLSHGDNDILYGKDGKFATESIFAPFRGDVCKSLVGKPKLFFIQACRGDRLDDGVTVLDTTDAVSRVYKVPSQADFLTCYSTVAGYYSWRNTIQGSWFIQAVCKVIKEHAARMDLLSMMTIVCQRVAYHFESCVPQDRKMDRRKQVPTIVSTLTRQVYFKSKF